MIRHFDYVRAGSVDEVIGYSGEARDDASSWGATPSCAMNPLGPAALLVTSAPTRTQLRD